LPSWRPYLRKQSGENTGGGSDRRRYIHIHIYIYLNIRTHIYLWVQEVNPCKRRARLQSWRPYLRKQSGENTGGGSDRRRYIHIHIYIYLNIRTHIYLWVQEVNPCKRRARLQTAALPAAGEQREYRRGLRSPPVQPRGERGSCRQWRGT